jgi:hypothetical protein
VTAQRATRVRALVAERSRARAEGVIMDVMTGFLRCGGEASGAAAGSFVYLPGGCPHRFWAAGTGARRLLIAVPGGIEDYFRETSAACRDGERARTGERHGIRVVPG